MRVGSVIVVGALLAASRIVAAADAEVTLTVHHFLGPQAPAQTALIEPWAERVMAQSEGRIAIEIYPAMALGGKPPDLYRQVRDGVADVVWTLPGYTPGVFPRVEVFELPTVHEGSALATNLAIQDLYEEHLAADFTDIQPLLVHVHSGNALHLVDRPVRAPADVAGLKLRTPSRTGAWMIEGWGAEPVGMPAPELPQALATGTIDGALLPFEVVLPLKVHELTEYSVEGEGGGRFGTATFLFAMNKERYEGLPDELRAVIDDNSGAELAATAGRAWDAIEPRGRQTAEAAGTEVIALDADVKAAFDERGAVAVERWIEEVAARGIDGAALVEAARDAVAAHKP